MTVGCKFLEGGDRAVPAGGFVRSRGRDVAVCAWVYKAEVVLVVSCRCKGRGGHDADEDTAQREADVSANN